MAEKRIITAHFAVINEFMNQQHDVLESFMNLMKQKNGSVRTIRLPVELEFSVKEMLYSLFGESGINQILITENEVKSIFRPLMFCNHPIIAEEFKIINNYATSAMLQASDSLKHRTKLIIKIE